MGAFQVDAPNKPRGRLILEEASADGIGGKVGVWTNTPGAKLQVEGGGAAITTQGSGLILRATDGPLCFRVTVNIQGQLSATGVTCPP